MTLRKLAASGAIGQLRGWGVAARARTSAPDAQRVREWQAVRRDRRCASSQSVGFRLVPAQGCGPWTFGLKVGLSDVRDVPPDQSKTHSVFEIDRRSFSPFRRVSQTSVLVAVVIAAPPLAHCLTLIRLRRLQPPLRIKVRASANSCVAIALTIARHGISWSALSAAYRVLDSYHRGMSE